MILDLTSSQDIINIGITNADQNEKIDLAEAYHFSASPENGGLNMFVGMVRDYNHGRNVVGVSYDIFQPLVTKRFLEIAEKANVDYGPARVYVRHAHGRLQVGDIAVVVVVGTRHRDEAFRACRDVIEAVKHTAPIWKQEHYVDGDTEWTEGCALCPSSQRS